MKRRLLMVLAAAVAASVLGGHARAGQDLSSSSETDISDLRHLLNDIKISIDTLSNDFLRYIANFNSGRRTPKVALPVLGDTNFSQADEMAQLYCVQHGWTGAAEVAIEGVVPSRTVVFRCENVPLAPK